MRARAALMAAWPSGVFFRAALTTFDICGEGKSMCSRVSGIVSTSDSSHWP